MSFLRRLSFLFWYTRRAPWDSGIVPPEVEAFIREHPAGRTLRQAQGRALDLGCGTGTSSLALARAGWDVTGVDFVSRAIKSAKQKAKGEGIFVDFRVDDVTRLRGISGPFDLVLDIGCFHSLDEKGKSAYLEQMGRLLAPGGTWLVYAFVQGGEEPGAGLTEQEIQTAAQGLRLARRQDGSERGQRPSAWLWFERQQGRTRPRLQPV
jgi:SAM-dependent methyltransferase